MSVTPTIQTTGAFDAQLQMVHRELRARIQDAQGPVDGQRGAFEQMRRKECPLGFSSTEQYRQFVHDVTVVADATKMISRILLTGSSTTGYSRNPSKPLDHSFGKNSDYDLIFEGPLVPAFMESHQYKGSKGLQYIKPYPRKKDRAYGLPTVHYPEIYGHKRTHHVFAEFERLAEKWTGILEKDVEFTAWAEHREYPALDSDFTVYEKQIL